MPFTPLHMGPGIVIKVVMQRRFSLMVFGWSQIVMDIQPLVAMVRDKGELHGLSHTFLGATVLGLLAALSGKYLGAFGLRFIREPSHLPISWSVAFVSAYIGTYSHVLIDSVMHSDLTPFLPFSLASPLHGIISIDVLHIICLVSAALGGLVYFVLTKKNLRK